MIHQFVSCKQTGKGKGVKHHHMCETDDYFPEHYYIYITLELDCFSNGLASGLFNANIFYKKTVTECRISVWELWLKVKCVCCVFIFIKQFGFLIDWTV